MIIRIFLALLALLPPGLSAGDILPRQVCSQDGQDDAERFKLAVCAIFQNEAPYLREWIEFHLLQGAEHFFLYNNNSTDGFAEALSPYIDAGIVTLTDWPHTYSQGSAATWLSIQSGAYMHCIRTAGHLTTWLAAIDVDEFLFCPSGEPVPSFLARYQSFGGVCAHWLLFGTSHLETIPPDTLMIEALTLCAPADTPRNRYIKSIVQPRYVKDGKTAHCFIYHEGIDAVDAYKNKVTAELSDIITHDRIRINHYWTRTESHFRERKIESRNKRRNHENEEWLRQMAATYNDSSDTAILQFVPLLRRSMGLSSDEAGSGSQASSDNQRV